MSQRNWMEWNRVAVVGAGNMGTGIAQKYATEGHPVVLVDLDDDAVARGRERVRRSLEEAVERKIHTAEQAEAVSARMEFTTDLEKLAGADLVVEAVFEDLAVKRDLFSKLGTLTGPETVLATNTSSFYVKDLAKVTEHPERVLGLHYFYHPAKNRLVEVISGPSTPDDLLSGVWDLQAALGKTPIASADSPGFIVNRFFVPWINEAARMLDEKIGDVPTIEQAAMETFGIGMGPFGLMNVTGIPIGYHAASSLRRELGDFYKPAACIKARMDSGEPFDVSGDADRARFREIGNRLLGLTFHICGELVSEGVGTVEDTDIGARVGLRWPRGPFEMMNRLGVGPATDFAEVFEARYGLNMPEVLQSQRDKGVPFPIRLIQETRENGLAFLTFNRPDAMNALNEQVLSQFEEAFDRAAADSSVEAIVLRGAGKAFVAGADIRFFIEALEAGDFPRVREFTLRGHRVMNKVDHCPKPVIVQLDGLALGGGLELALAADYIVATQKATLGFPETGIGIYPALGGTQRTSRRVGLGLTRYLVLTGRVLDAETARRFGLVDELVTRKDLRAALARLAGEGPRGDEAHGPAPNGQTLLEGRPAADREVAAVFAKLDVEEVLAGKTPDLKRLSGKARGALEKAFKALGHKAPVALRLADRVIREGAPLPLDEGIELELAALTEIFETKDAREGLKALAERRRPEFKGA